MTSANSAEIIMHFLPGHGALHPLVISQLISVETKPGVLPLNNQSVVPHSKGQGLFFWGFL